MSLLTEADLTQQVQISRLKEIAEGIFEFELRHPSGEELPAFTAGAHLCVEAPNGLIRRYSLSNDPGETDRYVIAIKREEHGTGGSKSLTDECRSGDMIRISEPRNDFELNERAPRYIFIAGGIGVTPLLSMMRHLKSTTNKPFKLYYLSRDPAQTAYREELSAPEFRGKVVMHQSHGIPDNQYDLWPVLEQHKGAYLYCCGPRKLMEAVRDMTGHWPKSQVRFEDFGAAAAQHHAEDKPFTLRIKGNDTPIEVAADATILEAMQEHGYRVPFSCESGTCGSCRCNIVEGEVDHRDLILSDSEKQRYIMVCVSRAKSDELVIELES